MKSRLVVITILMLFMYEGTRAQLTYETLWVQYDSVWSYKNLQLVPIRFKPPGEEPAGPAEKAKKFLTLPEAMLQGKIKIREMQSKEGASVNSLEVVNTSKEYILINSGEILSGGKQDRVISETNILPPGKETHYIDVFCVEKGRWDDKPKSFRTNGRANQALKKVMDRSLRQSEIWKEIQRQFNVKEKSSATWSYLALEQNKNLDSGYLKFFTERYRASDSMFAGFVALTGNRIASCELFATTYLTTASYTEILKGFIEEAVERGNPPVIKKEKIATFMDRLLENEKAQKEFVAGRGKIDKSGNKVIHIVVYGDEQ